MKIKYLESKRARDFNLGYSQLVEVEGRKFQCYTSPGKRVRLAYSSKYGYHWYGSVTEVGKGIVWNKPCEKNTSPKAMLQDLFADEFLKAAFGRDFATREYYREHEYLNPRLKEAWERIKQAEFEIMMRPEFWSATGLPLKGD